MTKQKSRSLRFLIYTILILCISTGWAKERKRCGTQAPDINTRNKLETRLGLFNLRVTLKEKIVFKIPICFHVITNGAKGNVTDAQLDKQVTLLNKLYKGYGFKFEKKSVRRINNASWFSMTDSSDAEKAAKKKLNVNPKENLNIYTVEGGDLLGWATWPWDLAKEEAMDGVVVAYGSLPKGKIRHYNQGKTVVHEVGHWLGLYHTFQNGCESPGDEVADTPYEASAASGCPEGRDSCPQLPGEAPIHNYMDYSYDSCMIEFTLGQAARMKAKVMMYRKDLH
jgi:Pregnancy-associated plasma protein-A